jgi:hypothetical protein
MIGQGVNVERVVLRAAVGHDAYAQVEKIASLLDELERRGVISRDGLGAVVRVLADEIVTATVLRDFGSDLSFGEGEGDTPGPEDP